MICTKNYHRFGSPNKAGTHDCPGAPLIADEITATKAALWLEHSRAEIS